MGHLDHPPPIFTPDALPAATLPIYPGLGEAGIYWIAYPVAWFKLAPERLSQISCC